MIQVQVRGLEEVAAELKALESALDVNEILDASGAFLLFRIRERFLRQEDTDGRRWPESKAAVRRRTKGRGGGTLFDTGTLFNSISLGRVGPNARSIFTDVEYAEKHQFGLDGLPVREFLGFSPADEVGVNNIIEARIRQVVSS